MKIIKAARRIRDMLTGSRAIADEMRSRMMKIQQSLGRIELRQIQAAEGNLPSNREFQVFSQWGEDGIIQNLINNIEINRKIFIEFGVENYLESNTRFLLVNNNWSGLVMEANAEHVNFIKKDPIYWKYNLKAVQAFITRENINDLISENGINGEVGLLSIDMDGNDYWVWEAIDVVSPAVVIIEYNYRFGKERAVTIPYESDFRRNAAHHSNIYYGASLRALCLLGRRKDYVFVGCNSAGNNAFFVRGDLKTGAVRECTAEEGFVRGAFRESRNPDGEMAFLTEDEEEEILSSLPLVNV